MANMISCPWNSIEKDRLYDADDFAFIFKAFFTEGVFPFDANNFFVQAVGTGMQIRVKTGACLIDGRVAKTEEDTTFTLSNGGTLPRIDSVVVQLNATNREINLVVNAGTEASNPSAKSLTRTGSIYEICLAQIYVDKAVTVIKQANIKDTRANENLCGYVTGNCDQIATSTLLAQMEAWFNDSKADFSNYVDTVKAILDAADPSGAMLNEIIDAREGSTNLKNNLINNYVKKSESGLGTTAPTYSAHTKTGMFSKTTNNIKYNVVNIYDGSMATQIGVDKTNNKPVYQSTVSPYPMVNILTEKDNFVVNMVNTNSHPKGAANCVIPLANGLFIISGWFQISPAASGANYGSRTFELPEAQQNWDTCINLQATPIQGQCEYQAYIEKKNGKWNITVYYGGGYTDYVIFSYFILVQKN